MLHGQIWGLGSPQNLIDIHRALSKLVSRIEPIGDESTLLGVIREWIDCRQTIALREFYNQTAICEGHNIRGYDEAAMRFALECLKRLFNISLAAYGQSDQLYLQELRAVFRRFQIRQNSVARDAARARRARPVGQSRGAFLATFLP